METREFEDWAHVRQRHAGRVVVLGSGPSSRELDLAQHAGVPVLAMNGSIRRCDECGVRPLFYLCDDRGFAFERWQDVARAMALAEHVAIGWRALERFEQAGGVVPAGCRLFLLEHVNHRHGRRLQSDRLFAWQMRKDPELLASFSLLHARANRLGFSRNMARGYYCARTIAYAALQLACHLGFSDVLLSGVELDSGQGRVYEEAGQGADSARLRSRLDDDFAGHILPQFRFMAERALGADFQVSTMARQTRLPAELIPRLGGEALAAWLDAGR